MDARETYDEMYQQEKRYLLRYEKTIYVRLFDAMFEILKQHGGGKVLEVGCGSGALAQRLLELETIQYKGFDLSAEGIDIARQRLAATDLFAVGDATDPANYTGDYDTIVCSEVLEHLPDDRGAVALWRPGTYCICSVPNFPYPTHERVFETEQSVFDRYGDLIHIESVKWFPAPLVHGVGWPRYLRRLRWSRNHPGKFLAQLGLFRRRYRSGWFLFTGVRK